MVWYLKPDFANICYETDNKNRLIQSKNVVVWSINIITLLGRTNQQMTVGCKDWLTASLTEHYSNICDQDHSKSKLLFDDDLAEKERRPNATTSLNQSISSSSTTPSRNALANYQSNKSYVNSRGKKKNFDHPTGQSRFPHKITPDCFQKRK